MGCVKKAEHAAERIAAPLIDAGTAVFAPELLPVVAPAVGAISGGLQNGLRGAVTGGLEGAVAGQIGGTGDLALGATSATGPADAFGLATGGQSLAGQAFDFAGNALGGVTDSLGITSPNSAATDLAQGFGTNAAGAPVNSSGSTIAAPSSATSTAPSSGSVTSASSVGNLGEQATNAILSPNDVTGASTSASPGLGSIGATDTFTGFGSQPGGANIAGAVEGPNSAFTPASAGGVSDFLPSKKDIGRAAIPLASIAYEAIKGPSQLPGSAAALQPGGAATQPLLDLEKQGATEATTGQLTAPQQANVLQFVQQSQNALLSQLAQEGVTNPTQDSRYVAGLQQIQQQALALQQQYITAAISQATSAGGAASQNIATAANEQIQNDTAFQTALAEAFGALGGVGGINARAA